MQILGNVQPFQKRPFDQPGHQFSGNGTYSANGEMDSGLAYLDWKRWLIAKLSEEGKGQVLAPNKRRVLTPALRSSFMAKNSAWEGIGALPPSQKEEEAIIKRLGAIAKDDQQTERMNEYAQHSIRIIIASTTANVQQVLTPICDECLEQTERAVDEFFIRGDTLWTGTATDIKRNLLNDINTTGIARDVKEMQMLISNFQLHRERALLFLTVPNPAAVAPGVPARVLRDTNVSLFSDSELMDKLLQRMAQDSTSLQFYREDIIRAKTLSANWLETVNLINERINRDLPSINMTQDAVQTHLAKRTFAATLDQPAQTSISNAATALPADIYQQIVQEVVEQASKRIRADLGVTTTGNSPGLNQLSGPCFYYDGRSKTCDRESKTGACPAIRYHYGDAPPARAWVTFPGAGAATGGRGSGPLTGFQPAGHATR
jgi:hypothetical protein